MIKEKLILNIRRFRMGKNVGYMASILMILVSCEGKVSLRPPEEILKETLSPDDPPSSSSSSQNVVLPGTCFFKDYLLQKEDKIVISPQCKVLDMYISDNDRYELHIKADIKKEIYIKTENYLQIKNINNDFKFEKKVHIEGNEKFPVHLFLEEKGLTFKGGLFLKNVEAEGKEDTKNLFYVITSGTQEEKISFENVVFKRAINPFKMELDAQKTTIFENTSNMNFENVSISQWISPLVFVNYPLPMEGISILDDSPKKSKPHFVLQGEYRGKGGNIDYKIPVHFNLSFQPKSVLNIKEGQIIKFDIEDYEYGIAMKDCSFVAKGTKEKPILLTHIYDSSLEAGGQTASLLKEVTPKLLKKIQIRNSHFQAEYSNLRYLRMVSDAYNSIDLQHFTFEKTLENLDKIGDVMANNDKNIQASFFYKHDLDQTIKFKDVIFKDTQVYGFKYWTKPLNLEELSKEIKCENVRGECIFDAKK